MKNGQSILYIHPVAQKFRQNRSISEGLGDTSNLKFYHFCQKFENSKWLPFLERGKFFLNGQSILHIYPVGQKFRRNRSISHDLGDTSNFKFYHFCQKFENSKWLPFLERGKLFEKWAEYLAHTPCGPKISPKSLYLGRFRRYKLFKVLPFLSKIRKFKMATILGKRKIFRELSTVSSMYTL